MRETGIDVAGKVRLGLGRDTKTDAKWSHEKESENELWTRKWIQVMFNDNSIFGKLLQMSSNICSLVDR